MRNVALVVLGLAACSPDNVQTRVSEVVVTRPEGTKRMALAYTGNRVSEVRGSADGTDAGTIRFVYDGARLSRLDVTDRDGDPATQTYLWTGDNIARESFVAGDVYARDRAITYAGGMISTQSFMLAAQGTTQMWTEAYGYEDGRVTELAITTGPYVQTTALTYGADGLADVTTYDDNDTYEAITFGYADGQLAEITGTHPAALTYNADGRIARIEMPTETFEYTYESGDSEGVTFSPQMPYGEMFDLDGTSIGQLDVLHMPVPYPADLRP